MIAPIVAPAIGASGLPGSAAIAAFAGGPVGVAVGAVIASFAAANELIGRGRREADIIVPIQNQMGELLRNVNLQKDDPTTTTTELYQLRDLVNEAYQKFDEFTRDARFTDGRASVQARDTIRPLVDGKNNAGQLVREDGGTIGNIDRLLAERGGGGLLSGGAAGDSNGLVWAGAAALAAKLLGFF